MGFLLKALGVGLAVAGVKKIKHKTDEKIPSAVLMEKSPKKSSMLWSSVAEKESGVLPVCMPKDQWSTARCVLRVVFLIGVSVSILMTTEN